VTRDNGKALQRALLPCALQSAPQWKEDDSGANCNYKQLMVLQFVILQVSRDWNILGRLCIIFQCFKTKDHIRGNLGKNLFDFVSKKLKVKESCNRPGVAQRAPGGLGSQISRHSARKGGEFVSLTHRPPLPLYSFSLGAKSTPGPWCGRKEIGHWKIQWHHRELIPAPSDCSALTTTLPQAPFCKYLCP
jgi:hypothetical protein